MVVRSNIGEPRIVTLGPNTVVRALKFIMYFLFAIKDTGLIDETFAVAALSVNPYSGPSDVLTFPPEKPAAKNVGA